MASFPEQLLNIIRFLHKRRMSRGIGRSLHLLGKLLPTLRSVRVKMNEDRYIHLDLQNLTHVTYLLEGEVPYCEEGEILFYKSTIRPGDIVFDIGSFVGAFATLFAKLVGDQGEVHAFEPNPNHYPLLQKTQREYPNLHFHYVALGDSEGELELNIPEQGWFASFGKVDRIKEKHRVPIKTLDKIVEKIGKKPTYIKCDVEGFELFVLKGAQNLISSEKPPLWVMEASPARTQLFSYMPDAYIEFFRSLDNGNGYTFYDVLPDGKLTKCENAFIRMREGIASYYVSIVPLWLHDRIAPLVK